MPMVTVPAFGHVFLGEGYVRCDRTVEKVKRMAPDDRPYGRGKQIERREDAFAQGDVGARAPRPKRLRLEKNPRQGDPESG